MTEPGGTAKADYQQTLPGGNGSEIFTEAYISGDKVEPHHGLSDDAEPPRPFGMSSVVRHKKIIFLSAGRLCGGMVPPRSPAFGIGPIPIPTQLSLHRPGGTVAELPAIRSARWMRTLTRDNGQASTVPKGEVRHDGSMKTAAGAITGPSTWTVWSIYRAEPSVRTPIIVGTGLPLAMGHFGCVSLNGTKRHGFIR